MSDDLFGKLDEALSEKKKAAELAEQAAREKAAQLRAQRQKNLDFIQTVMLPAIEETAEGLRSRKVGCHIKVEDNQREAIVMYFNPSGKIHGTLEENANVRFLFGSDNTAQVHKKTFYRGSTAGGVSSSAGSVLIDENVEARVKEKIVEIVLETIKK